MKHILMLLSNAYRPDPRVEREAVTLAQAGYRVSVVCWDREAELPAFEQHEQVEIHRVHSVPTRYGAGPRQLFKTPLFWRAAFNLALEMKPDAVHCHDLDTLYAGIRIKQKLGCPLVFDAHEEYPALMSQYLPGFMVASLRWLETYLLKRVDATITASNVYAQKLIKQGQAHVTVVGNYQDLSLFDAVQPAEIAAARAGLGLNDDDYVVSYIGGFSRNRLLLPLVEAAAQVPEVKLLLWGDGHQSDAVAQAASRTVNVRYLGWLPPELVPLHFLLSDVIYYCLLPDYPGANYNAPNTLSNAMAAGRPIIANDVGDLGSIVRGTGCGLLVPEVTSDHIRQAITTLQDPSLRQQMGQAGRRAAQAEYNWQAAEQHLYAVYQDILALKR